jgi:hypothetical protein
MFHRLKNTRPPAALVIAVIALFASLGGASYAAVSITGKDVKNSSLTGKDVKNSSLTGKDVKNGGLSGSDVKGDSLSGNQILESQLGKVPSATNADQAATAGSASSADNANTVGGVTVRSFKYRVPGASADQVVLTVGGLQLMASCTGATTHLTATTMVADTQIDGYSVEPDVAAPANQNAATDEDFQPGDTVNVVPDDEDNEVGSLRYSRGDGGGVQVAWHANTAGTVAGCGVNGVATAF